MRKIILKVKKDSDISTEDFFEEIKKNLIIKKIKFKGILIEIKTKIAYVWDEI